jgi:hypothetical protein
MNAITPDLRAELQFMRFYISMKTLEDLFLKAPQVRRLKVQQEKKVWLQCVNGVGKKFWMV